MTHARLSGLLKYATGKACKRGHFSERYASTGQCVVCIADQSSAWHKANPEYCREKGRQQYWADPAAMQLAGRLWREANPERMSELSKAWHAKNPGARCVHEANRRARKKAAGGSHTLAEIEDLAEKQKHKCVYCRKSIRKNRHVDHRIPIAKGGNNWIENIQLLCPSCNHKKQAKHPIKFAQEMGFLL